MRGRGHCRRVFRLGRGALGHDFPTLPPRSSHSRWRHKAQNRCPARQGPSSWIEPADICSEGQRDLPWLDRQNPSFGQVLCTFVLSRHPSCHRQLTDSGQRTDRSLRGTIAVRECSDSARSWRWLQTSEWLVWTTNPTQRSACAESLARIKSEWGTYSKSDTLRMAASSYLSMTPSA